MRATNPGHGNTAPDNSRDLFERWSTNRSFSMLGPLSRIGLVVVLLMLLVVDPLLFGQGVWGQQAQHHYLVLWHACAAIHFSVFLLLSKRLQTHRSRQRCLIAFLALGGALFTWFGFISWNLSGCVWL